LCAEVDAAIREGGSVLHADGAGVMERWNALPALAGAAEKRMTVRRDAALRALEDEVAAVAHCKRIEAVGKQRLDLLLELEVLLGLDSPQEYQADRLAFQVKQLRDRFKSAASVGPEQAPERLLAWCELPGTVEARDRTRIDRIFNAVGRRR